MDTKSQVVKVSSLASVINSDECARGARFRELLEQLCEEHDNEVFHLCSRVQTLEKLLESNIPLPSHLPPQLPGTANFSPPSEELREAAMGGGHPPEEEERRMCVGFVTPSRECSPRNLVPPKRSGSKPQAMPGESGSAHDQTSELLLKRMCTSHTCTSHTSLSVLGHAAAEHASADMSRTSTPREAPREAPIAQIKASSTMSSAGTYAGHYALKEQWLQAPDPGNIEDVDMSEVRKCAERMQAQSSTITMPFERQGTIYSKMQKVSGMIHCSTVSPTSHQRVLWDLTGLCFIGWDMILIPVFIAFTPDENWFLKGVGWLILIYWTLDMLASCNTGYFRNGRLEMRRKKIVKNYMQGWFWIDLVVVVPDYIMKTMGTINVSGLGRILRVARVVRILRLLRLLKLKKIIDIIYDLIDNEYMFLVFNCVKLVFIIMFMNHLVACAWYLVGKLSKDNGASKNWLQDVGMTPVDGTDFGWKYLTSLHWSITQFTPASMDISATNSAERLFSVFILFWALVALSSFIGSVSASITAMRNLTNDEMTQFWLLRRYLKQKAISKDLTDRLLRYLEFRTFTKHNQIEIHKVTLLRHLSEQLNIELANEMNGPILRNHPFFDVLAEQLPVMHCRLCQTTLTRHSLANADFMFELGADAEAMYFIVNGAFEYKLGDGQRLSTPIGPNLWAGEAVLWVSTWRHKGYLVAQGPAETVGVNPYLFLKTFEHYPRCFLMAQSYGLEFVKYINGVKKNALTDVMYDPAIWSTVATEAGARASIKSKSEVYDDIFQKRFVCPQAARLRGSLAEEEPPQRKASRLIVGAFDSMKMGAIDSTKKNGMLSPGMLLPIGNKKNGSH